MSNSTFDKLEVGRDEVGAVLADQQALIDQLTGDQQIAASIDVNQVEPATPFVVGTGRFKNGQIKLPVAFNVPTTLEDLTLVWIRTADRDTDVHFAGRQIPQEGVPFDDPSSGQITVDTPWFETGTQYDLLRTVGRGTNLGRVKNPTDAPLRTDPPLAQLTTSAGANAPSKPTLARIINNTFKTTEDGLIPIVTVRVFADDAEALTFGAQQTTQIQSKFLDVVDTSAHPRRTTNIEDSTVTFIDIEVGDLFVLGRQYNWVHNIAFSGVSGEGAIALPAATVAFFAGGFADPSNLTTLTLVSVTAEPTDDPATLNITWTLHQPNPPFRLKNYTAKRKVSGRPDSDFDLAKNLVVDRASLIDPIYNVAGNIIISHSMTVNPAKTYVVELIARTVGSFSKTFTSGDVHSTSTVAAGAGVATPSLVNGGGFYASLNDYNTVFGGVSVPADAKYAGDKWMTSSNSGTRIDNLAGGGGGSLDSFGLQWRDTESRLMLNTNVVTKAGKPANILRGRFLRPDQIYTLAYFLICDTADITVDITNAFYDQGTPGDITSTALTGIAISHTVQSLFVCFLTIPHAYTNAGKQWIEIMRLGADPTQKIYVAAVNLQPGIVDPSKWAAHVQEALITPGNITYHGEGAAQVTGIVLTDAGGNVYDPVTRKGGILSL